MRPLVAEPEGTRGLEVGRTAFMLDGADLRYLTFDGTELVRRIYLAIRDEDWATLEPDDVTTDVRRTDQEIVIRAECRHTSPAAAIRWSVEARVEAGGETTYLAEFTPLKRFRFARIGICVLLPPAALVGRRFSAATETGTVAGEIAAEIAPQWIEGEEIRPMFDAFSELRIEAVEHRLELRFDGDLFEMEDQRNWSDGSFKIYGTPLSRPRPQQAEPDRPIVQRLHLRASARHQHGARTTGMPAEGTAEVRLTPVGRSVVPGFGLSLEGARAAAATASLSDLGLDHVHLGLGDEDDRVRLAEAAELATGAGASLHVAFRTADSEAATLADLLAPHADLIAWVLAFDRSGIGSEESVGFAEEVLSPVLPRARFAAGTDLAFADLNRTRPTLADVDAISWAVDPQVHGADALTVVEALAAQADQIATASSFAPGSGALVGPIQLSPPPGLESEDAERFVSAWTTASFAILAGAGAVAATYRRWPPAPPAGTWSGRSMAPVQSSEPLAVAALAIVEDGARAELLLVNLRNRPTDVRVRLTTDSNGTEVALEPYGVRTIRIPAT